MARKKLEDLLRAVEREVVKAKKAAESTKQSADEIAKHAAHSPSQSGDRTHSQGQAEITESYYQRVLAFKERIEKALHNEAESVTPPCFVKLEFADRSGNSFYLVEDPISIVGFTLVSASSPLGSALVGKKAGSSFRFKSNVEKKSGKIANIE